MGGGNKPKKPLKFEDFLETPALVSLLYSPLSLSESLRNQPPRSHGLALHLLGSLKRESKKANYLEAQGPLLENSSQVRGPRHPALSTHASGFRPQCLHCGRRRQMYAASGTFILYLKPTWRLPAASDRASQVGCLKGLATCDLSLTLPPPSGGTGSWPPVSSHTPNTLRSSLGRTRSSLQKPAATLLAGYILAASGTWSGPSWRDGHAFWWHDLLLLLVRKPELTQRTRGLVGTQARQAGEGCWLGHHVMSGRTQHWCAAGRSNWAQILAWPLTANMSLLTFLTWKIGTVIPTSENFYMP